AARLIAERNAAEPDVHRLCIAQRRIGEILLCLLLEPVAKPAGKMGSIAGDMDVPAIAPDRTSQTRTMNDYKFHAPEQDGGARREGHGLRRGGEALGDPSARALREVEPLLAACPRRQSHDEGLAVAGRGEDWPARPQLAAGT